MEVVQLRAVVSEIEFQKKQMIEHLKTLGVHEDTYDLAASYFDDAVHGVEAHLKVFNLQDANKQHPLGDTFEKAEQERKAQAKNLTIGHMLDLLSKFENDVEVQFSNGKYFSGDIGSYRGHYTDFYLGFSEVDCGYNNVLVLKDALEIALFRGDMEGYSGGEFPIEKGTLVWFAEYGTTEGAEAIKGIRKVDGKVVIVTEPVKD